MTVLKWQLYCKLATVLLLTNHWYCVHGLSRNCWLYFPHCVFAWDHFNVSQWCGDRYNYMPDATICFLDYFLPENILLCECLDIICRFISPLRNGLLAVKYILQLCHLNYGTAHWSVCCPILTKTVSTLLWLWDTHAKVISYPWDMLIANYVSRSYTYASNACSSVSRWSIQRFDIPSSPPLWPKFWITNTTSISWWYCHTANYCLASPGSVWFAVLCVSASMYRYCANNLFCTFSLSIDITKCGYSHAGVYWCTPLLLAIFDATRRSWRQGMPYFAGKLLRNIRLWPVRTRDKCVPNSDQQTNPAVSLGNPERREWRRRYRRVRVDQHHGPWHQPAHGRRVFFEVRNRHF